MKQLHQLTDWLDPEELIQSQWGNIFIANWLNLEARRWTASGRAAEVKNKHGRQALFAEQAFLTNDNE